MSYNVPDLTTLIQYISYNTVVAYVNRLIPIVNLLHAVFDQKLSTSLLSKIYTSLHIKSAYHAATHCAAL